MPTSDVTATGSRRLQRAHRHSRLDIRSGFARGERGAYSLAELLVVVVLFSIVMAAIAAVLVSQRRFYTTHTRIADTRDAVRVAADVLSGGLRQIDPLDGDLYAMASDSVAFRALVGFGVLCAAAGDRLSVGSVSGTFGDEARDSALVFVEGREDTRSDDRWAAAAIWRVGRGGGECPGGSTAGLELTLDREISGTLAGAPIRAFRPYVYRLYRGGDGRWWLGRRLRAGTLQPVAGPFDDPQAGGLRFEFLTADGSPAPAPARVAQVRIRVRGRSADRIHLPSGVEFYTDTLSTVVFLRNAAAWGVAAAGGGSSSGGASSDAGS